MIHRTQEDVIMIAIEMFRGSFGNGDSRMMAQAIVRALGAFKPAQITAEQKAQADAAAASEAA
jgi:hypothetical protein